MAWSNRRRRGVAASVKLALLLPGLLPATALAQPAPGGQPKPPEPAAAAPAPAPAAPAAPDPAPAPAAPAAGPAAPASAPVRIATSDAKGLIYLDGALVGEGSFVGEVPAGTHKLRITREGYDPFEEDIVIRAKEPFARTVTLKLSEKIETGPVQEVDRLEGLYGGFSLLALFTPGGTGNDIEVLCEGRDRTPSLAGCEANDGFGGGVGGFLGYHWDPVGIELFVGAQYDGRSMKADWNAQNTDPGIGPDPARIEEYTLPRIGAMVLPRARVTFQTKKLRFTTALGAGFVRRIMFLERDTVAKDASGDRDRYVSESTGYWSPIVSIEPAIMYRLSATTSIGAGIQFMLDAPNTIFSGNPKDENPRSNREPNHSLGGRGLATNELDLARNVQVFIGPFIGMMFGP